MASSTMEQDWTKANGKMRQFQQVNDAMYAYSVQGKGEPLVLLHGFTGTHKTWKKCVTQLSEKYRVISIDLPGHGETITRTPRSMEQFSHDLKKLLYFLHEDKVHLLGYSMGGRAALSFAMYFPENVHTLILESASPGLRTVDERKTRMENDAKMAYNILENGLEQFIRFWENIPLFHTQKRLSKEIREKIRRERLSQTEIGLAESLLYMGTGKQPSWWEKLNELTTPVLLIVGSQDEKFVRMNTEMQHHIKNCSLEIVTNAGHAVHIEQVEKFVKIVMKYLDMHVQ